MGSGFSFPFLFVLVDWTKQKKSNMSHEFESLVFFFFFEGGVERASLGEVKGLWNHEQGESMVLF